MAVWCSRPDVTADKSPGNCKLCGKELVVVSIPIWDDPGDCVPIIDGYQYGVKCNECKIRTEEFDTVAEAVKNCIFLSSQEVPQPPQMHLPVNPKKVVAVQTTFL